MSECIVAVTEKHVEAPHTLVVCGRDSVLEWKDRLVELSRRYHQDAGMGYLEYHLARPVFARKKPTLILIFKEGCNGEGTAADDLEAAVLLYEYRVMGMGCRVYSGDSLGSSSTLIAPKDAAPRIAFAASAALLQRGALLVQISYSDEKGPSGSEGTPRPKGWLRPRWAARLREKSGYLPVEQTVDDTLANLGKTTRRNLRYYRRRLEADFQPEVIDHPRLKPEEFLEFTRRCTHEVGDDEALWRLESAEHMPVGSLFLGLRAGNGEWLSFIGGRTLDGVTQIEWQMNRADLPSYSLSTVMRSYLIEHEVECGTKRLYFLGGTSHSIKNAISSYMIVDLAVVRWGDPRWAARLVAYKWANTIYVMGQMLSSTTLEWHPW